VITPVTPVINAANACTTSGRKKERGKPSIIRLFLSDSYLHCPRGSGKPQPGAQKACSPHIEERETFLSRDLLLLKSIGMERTLGK
jgi:hypothetical protein